MAAILKPTVKGHYRTVFMERLPFEVLECIINFLSEKDLFQCCAVCKEWRQIFGDDTVWRRRCNIKLSDYLEKASSLVEPRFTHPQLDNNDLMPIGHWRLNFLRERHFVKNWRAGRYKREEIEFDCDDSISYNIKVECVDNDYVFLHMTFETQVWNIVQEPNLLLTIPFCLVELWERNLYKVMGNKLIVVQCNVVQIFKICIASKMWAFDCAFFFDKPEEFSSKITKEKDINKMFQETSSDIGETLERVITGNFLIGIVTTKLSLQNPVMHIWDLRTSKKIKEENCLEYFDSGVTNIFLETSELTNDLIVVTYLKSRQKVFTIYSLAKLEFLFSFHCPNGESILCDEYLCIYNNSQNTILKCGPKTNVTTEEVYKFERGRLSFWDVIHKKIVAANLNDLLLINPFNKTLETKFTVDFPLGVFQVVKDKYLALHDKERNLKEVLEMVAGDHFTTNKNITFSKLFSLPPDFGTFRATNDVCTKIVLERANKLIILNFW